MKTNIVKSFAVIIIFLMAVFFLIKNYTPQSISVLREVKIAGQNIKVDLAVTETTRTQGLSGRQVLNENEGMLFIFPESDRYSFWMKDMNFPIDIIWIGKNMKVVYIKKDARPELFPESYASTESAKYVLEVVSGFSDKNNLKVGDEVDFVFE